MALRVLALWGIAPTPASTLPDRIAALKRQERAANLYRDWDPDVFYYLFILVGAFWAGWLSRPLGSVWSIAGGAAAFVFLCFLPGIANRAGVWLLVDRPNRRLDRKIARLQAELDRRRNKADQAAEMGAPPQAQPAEQSASAAA